MSEFSDFLKKYMEEHDVSPGNLAKMIDYDRTSVFRYVKGTRIPSSRESVLKMIDALRMNVSERKKLLRYYDFLVMGKHVVESYEGAELLLRKFSEQEKNEERKEHYDKNMSGEFNLGGYPLNGSDEIYNAIIYLGEILDISGREQTLYVCMQPEYTVVQRYLQNRFEGKIKVEQIICLEQDMEKNQDNFKRFQEVLPSGIGSENYSVRFYYDHVESHLNGMNWMPNLIMGNDVVISFDKEARHGILVKDYVYYDFAKAWYQRIRENTTTLLYKVDGLHEVFPIQEIKEEIPVRVNLIFSQPCIGSCISSDIYRRNLAEIPGKEEKIRFMKEKNGDWDGVEYFPGTGEICMSSYFSKQGMLDFIQKGVVYEIPLAFYRPLDPEQRRLVLQRMILLAEKGLIELHVISDRIVIPNTYCCYLVENEKIMVINHISEADMIQMRVNEWGISQGFTNFMDYIVKKGLAADTKETVQWLKKIIKEL